MLDRTRGRASGAPALMEVVLDAAAEGAIRTRAARRLGLPDAARVLAIEGGAARIEATGAVPEHGRVGVGPLVPVLELPSSWEAARTALRFAADGTEQDPGARVVHADELGGLAVLAAAVAPGTKPVADVLALERARCAAPWVLDTLVTFASSPNLRMAATALIVHHSTLQDRITHVEQLLGWPVRDPLGRLRLRLRLQLALALRRLHLHS
ncbi:helix-turn-helix domain-containing protein [Amycolatopsis sp. NPDC051903]|uniref:helix-turn-helix domain-containing protein n=1 Tax=Amycolatopsis sp. NPDC051903 TaxID=3363936 RepID=UPI0037A1C6A7